jgi:hypothetical protein
MANLQLFSRALRQTEVVIIKLQSTALWASISIEQKHTFADICPFTKTDAILHLSPRYGRAPVLALAVEPYKRDIEGVLDFS